VYSQNILIMISSRIDIWKIALMITLFLLTGIIFQKTEYYVFTNQLGYAEVNEEAYSKWHSDPETSNQCKKKHIFNLPFGIVISSIVLLVFETVKYRSSMKLPLKLSKIPDSLKEFSNYYYEKGFNVTVILGDKQGNNVTQDSFKSPTGDWLDYKFIRQSNSYVEALEWDGATGIGAIAGVNNLICLDVDKCSKITFIERLLKALGLPMNYSWIIKSGSGNGFHIWLKSKSHIPSTFPYFDDPVIKFYPTSKYEGDFKQIEVRLSDHVVLPPSLNSEGRNYEFLYNLPETIPKDKEIMDIIKIVSRFAST